MASTRPPRTAVGIWLDRRTTSRPASAPSAGTWAETARGSIGLGARRWLSTSTDTVCAAAAKAAAVAAASPWRMAAAMLSGASSHSTGAPGSMAAKALTTAGNSS